MQVVSTCGGPNLTSCQFWATRGQLPATGVGLAGFLGFGFQFADGNCGQPFVGGTAVSARGFVCPVVVLAIPEGGNDDHSLNGATFTLSIMGISKTWTLTETPVGGTDIGIANNDTQLQVATKIQAAFILAFSAQYGFAALIVVPFVMPLNEDGTVDISFLCIDTALTGAVRLSATSVDAPLTVTVPFAARQYGFPLLGNAGRTFVYQGLGEQNLPVGADASTLNIVGRPVSPVGKRAWLPRIGTNVFVAAAPP